MGSARRCKQIGYESGACVNAVVLAEFCDCPWGGWLSFGQCGHLAMCGGLPPCQEGAAGCRSSSPSVFSPVCTQDELYNTLTHAFTVNPFSRSKNAEKSTVISHGSVSTMVRALDEQYW